MSGGVVTEEGSRMAWDFCNDPAFEPELEWARRLVREEIEPLDVVKPQMSRESYKRAAAPLKCRNSGAWDRAK